MRNQHDVVIFPDYRQANPYQTLLSDSVDETFLQIFGTIAEARDFLQQNGKNRHAIFHLHWEDGVYGAVREEKEAWRTARHFISELECFVDEGGSFVWTVHNAHPHRNRFPQVLQAMREALVRLVDVVLAHSPNAAARVAKVLGVADGQVVVVPHGNYLSAYDLPAPTPPTGDDGDETRFLMLGRLDAYKGIDRLLAAFASLADPTRLTIAGHVVEGALASLATLPEDVRARIAVREGFVPAEDVPALLAACDVILLPYEDILTSGSLLLALSAGKPVVAPAIATLQEMIVHGREGWLFEPRSTPALAEALAAAANASLAERVRMAEAARTTARAYPWARSGRMLSAVYADLVRNHRPRRRLSR